MQGLNFPGGLAGKTGTADTERGKEPTAWFVGFGPEVNPQYVVVCVIDQAGYGATAAAPVVRSIFSYLAAHPVTAPAIPPERGIVQSTTPVALPTTHAVHHDHHHAGHGGHDDHHGHPAGGAEPAALSPGDRSSRGHPVRGPALRP